VPAAFFEALMERHIPVLLDPTVELLAPDRGGVFVDCTLGLGGHARAILERAPGARLIGIDRDPQALALAAARLEEFGDRVTRIEGEFGELDELLDRAGVVLVAGILADLGVSSLQLDEAERGFSFRRDGPLDMRMGAAGMTAAEIVNSYAEGDLEKILREYGEERDARRIARAIATARERQPITTTQQLRQLISGAKGGGREWSHAREGRVDPATRAFQALRIEVNQELVGLRRLMEQAIHRLEQGGRLVVISYHSLEDRIVKTSLREFERGAVDEVSGRPRAETRLIEVLTKKPLRPTDEEVAINPRARSARLRAARRL
jgi:16S rRNA (cytosine1402-N4)-methyltransferase